MLFEEEHYGKLISEELGQYLLDWTKPKDRALVFEMTGVSVFTIDSIVYRRRSITKANSKAIIELMRVAVNNCTYKIAYGKKVKKELDKLLVE